LFAKFFPEAAKCAASRRKALYAERAARRREARYVHPRLEGLEERIVPDAYSFEHLNANNQLVPSSGAWTTTADWFNLTQNAPANNTPGPDDTADIPTGANCTLASTASATVQALSVEGVLSVAGALTIEANGNPGSGSFTDAGTVTVGSSSTTGPTATLDAALAAIAGGGILNIGNPVSGSAASVDVSKTMTNSGSVNVGGAGGSTGTLGAFVLTSSTPSLLNVYSNGAMDIDDTAILGGTTTISGGVVTAENIDAFTGANITITGTASVGSGPLNGNLVAEENASFTFASGSTVTLNPGATLGDGQFNIAGTLFVDEDLEATLSEFTLESTGLISGTGSVDWWNHEFDWEGGTIGGLTDGGFTIDGNADFQTSGAATKTLATTLTNTGSGSADFDGTGTLVIDGTGMPDGVGALVNEASAVLPMELSLPLVMGVTGDGGTPGLFTNSGYLNIDGNGLGAVTISAPLDNTAAGEIDCETGAGPLTLSDTSGTSILNGGIALNNDSLTISGEYTTTSGVFSVDNSSGTTLTGTLTIDAGASADLDTLILAASPVGGGGLITGAGDLELSGEMTWKDGDITGSGGLTVGGSATMSISGLGTLSRNVDNEGKIEWLTGSEFMFGSGVVVTNADAAVFEDENSGPSSISTFDNNGTLEVGAGDTLGIGTFTQSSTGTLQSDLASATSYGVVSVSGTATLDSTLDGNLEDGYQPSSGTSFEVLKFASSSGQFATVDPQGWSAQYNSTSVDLIAG
jgi:hypothetical protein